MLIDMATPSPDTVSHAPNDPVVTASAGLPSIAGYDVQELVGRGGMGKVYRAKHVALGRTIALKVMTHEQDERLTARFRDEARAVAKLQHPNIAQLFDTGTADGRPYYSMEFADGGTLAGKWDGKPQDPAATAATMECVARAIQHSHEHGILHRDLKPGNVLMATDGTPKVADFGLAKELPSVVAGNATLPAAAGLTRTGEVVGTPAYMPPEQASGVTSALTPAADVYSLGAMLYEGLTGRPPFQAPDALQTLFLVLSTEPVPPKTLQPKLPADLNTICLKCLEKQPKKRYATAGALADDLRRFLNGEPIVARPVSRVERAVKWARRHKAGAALVAVSAVLVVAVIGFGVWEAFNALRLREANEQLAKKNDELGQANADLEKSKAETESMLGFALETLDKHPYAVADKLAVLPHGEKLRVEVLNEAGATLDRIHAANPTRERVREYLMDGYARLGDARGTIGDLPGSETAYKRAVEAADGLVAARPNDVRYCAFRATCELKLAHALETLGRTNDAKPYYERGEKAGDDLEADHPENPDVLRLLTLAYSRKGLAAAANGEIADVERAYRRWADLSRRLAVAEPTEEKHKITAADWEVRLVSLLSTQSKFAEAETILGRVKDTLDRLPEPERLAVRKLACAYHEAVASVHYWRNEPAKADAAYRRALTVHEGLVKDYPDSPNFRRGVITVWTAIGSVWTFGGKPDDGRAAYTKARDLAAALVKDYPNDVYAKQLLDGAEKTLRDTAPEKK